MNNNNNKASSPITLCFTALVLLQLFALLSLSISLWSNFLMKQLSLSPSALLCPLPVPVEPSLSFSLLPPRGVARVRQNLSVLSSGRALTALSVLIIWRAPSFSDFQAESLHVAEMRP